MATIHVGDLPEGTKHCMVCGEPISLLAKKCIHCNSDQGRVRQKLGFGTNFLSMSVALVSVMGVVVPLLVESATPDDSHLIFSLQHATETELFVIVSNQGREPGTVALAYLQVRGGKNIRLRSSERTPVQIVEPKKTSLLHFHKFVFEGKRILPTLLFDAAPDQTCILSLEVTSFRGKHLSPKVESPCREFLPFVRDPSTTASAQ